MLVLLVGATHEAHPSPRCLCVGLTLNDFPYPFGDSMDFHHTHWMPRIMCEGVGHLQGFTYMPKFTYWESLTPEPLLLLDLLFC